MRAAMVSPSSTCHPSRPDLHDELWTINHLVAYLHVARSTAYLTTGADDFPPPLGIHRRGRLWIAAEVRAWAQAHRRPPALSPSKSRSPWPSPSPSDPT